MKPDTHMFYNHHNKITTPPPPQIACIIGIRAALWEWWDEVVEHRGRNIEKEREYVETRWRWG